MKFKPSLALPIILCCALTAAVRPCAGASLTWTGSNPLNPTFWDIGVTTNWLSGADPFSFSAGDSVTFDDSSATNGVKLIGNLLPAGITMLNNGTNYTFFDTGRIISSSLNMFGAGTLTIANSASNNFGPISLNSGTLAFNQAVDVTLPNSITGGGTLVKNNTNTLILSANNSGFSGALFINNGKLKGGAASSVGGATTMTIANGATYDINGFAANAPGLAQVYVQGDGYNGQGAIMNSGVYQVNSIASLTMLGDTTFNINNGEVDIAGLGGVFNGNGYKLTFTGGKGAGGINEFWIGSGSETDLGDIDVKGGRWMGLYTTGTTLGRPTNTLTLRTNCDFYLYGVTTAGSKKVVVEHGAGFVMGGPANSSNRFGGTMLIDAGMTGTLCAGTTTPSEYYGTIHGAGKLAIRPPFIAPTSAFNGLVNLTGTNIHTGGTEINLGHLRLSQSLALSNVHTITMTTNYVTKTASSRTSQNDAPTPTLELSGGVIIPPGVNVLMAGAYVSSTANDFRTAMISMNGSNEFQGTINVRGSGASQLQTVTAGDSLHISGPIRALNFTNAWLQLRGLGQGYISGPVFLTNGAALPAEIDKSDTGTWTFRSTGNTWGTLFSLGGTIALGANDALCTTAALNVQGGNVDLHGYNQTVSGVLGGTYGNWFLGNESTTSDSTLTYAGGSNLSLNFNARIVDGISVGTRKLGITVASGALLINSPSNTYSGPTVVQTGGIFGGGGAISNSPVTVNSTGILAPGYATVIGRLVLGNTLTLNGGSTNFFKINSTLGTNDSVVGLASVTYGGTLAVSNVVANPLTTANTFKLFNAAAYGGSFAAVVPASPGVGLAWDISTLTTDGTLRVMTAVITNNPITWRGGAAGNPNNWDLTTSNWLNGVTLTKFLNADLVTFDDSAVTSSVIVPGTVAPSSVTMNSSALNYTITGAGKFTTSTFTNKGSGSLTVANDQANTFGYIALQSGTLAYDQPVNVTEPAFINGAGSLRQRGRGTNTLLLTGDNSQFSGPVAIDGGTLKLGSATALGTGNSVTISNGATLDLNGFSGPAPGLNVVVEGAGVNGQGAIINSGGNGAINAISTLTLTGDTTVSAPYGEIDIGALGGVVNGNGHKFTLAGSQHGGSPTPGVNFVGTNEFWFDTMSDTDFGDIDIRGGRWLGFFNNTTLGRQTGTCTIRSNCNLYIYSSPTGGQFGSKPVVMEHNSAIIARNATFAGTINILTNSDGILCCSAGTPLQYDGIISGPGKLRLVYPYQDNGVKPNFNGTVVLTATNQFTGGAEIDLGHLRLVNSLAVGAQNTIVVQTNFLRVQSSRTLVPDANTPSIELFGGVTIPAGVNAQMRGSYSGGPSTDFRTALVALGGNTNTWQGPITCFGNGAIQFESVDPSDTFVMNGDVGDLTFPGWVILRGSGLGIMNGTFGFNGVTGEVDKQDPGTWVLNSPSNTWAYSFIQGGTLVLGTNNALCPAGQLNLAGGNLDLAGFNQTVNGALNGTSSGSMIGNNSTVSDSVLTYAGGTNVSTYGAQIVDNLGLGSRIVSFNVNSGRFLLTGSAFHTGPTTVQGSGVLGGNGYIASSPVTIQSGGTLAPGAATLSALTIASPLTFNAGATAFFRVDPTVPANDQVIGLPSVNFAGTLVISNVSATPLVNGMTLTLFNSTSFGGAFANVVSYSGSQTLQWDTSLLAVNGSITLTNVININPNPTNVNVQVVGNALNLSWATDHIGWRLQGQTNSIAAAGISTNWFTVPGSDTTNLVTVPLDPTRGSVFYRLVYP